MLHHYFINHSLCKRFKSNKLSLNTEKTFYLIFDRARVNITDGRNLNVIMGNITLTKVSSIKEMHATVDYNIIS